MTRVEIPVEAKLSAADLDAELKQLTQKINALGQSIAQANKVKFNPIGKATLDDLKRVQAEFEKMKRTSQLGADINRTGQGGKSFFDLDWAALSSNPIAREARRYGAFSKVMAGTGASFSQNAPAPGQRPPASPPGGGSAWAGAGRKIVGAGLKSAGPVGGAADEALGAGLSGGVMAGVAGLIGGVVALGVGKLVGGVMNKIGDAQTDAIGYDTLKRTLGDVNVGFSALRASMHAASDAFDGTYQQALKMGTEFARISGVSGKVSESLAQEVTVGGGFGRSFGLDPEQSNAFFATMRQFNITGNERDSQRLAMWIGESVAKSGAFSKTDEMLQAIASYTSQQTRMGLSAANVGDYTAMLGGMVGSKIPGLDVMGSAALLSRVNSAVSSGGNAGESGQNFTYMAVGKTLGLDPIQAAILREQGAFGTGAQAFGQGSLYRRWAQQYNLSAPGAAGASGTTNLQMLMNRFHSTYANNPEMMLNAMSNYFGVNTSQAMALDTIKPEHLGALQGALNANNIDITKMSPTAISSLAQIAIGDRGTLKDQASQIWSKLSSGEQSSLDVAGRSGNIEDLRNELLKDYAKHGQADTEGEQTRKTIQDLDKDMQDAASKMITPLNDVRQILLYAFGDRGKMSMADITKAEYVARYQELDKQRKAAYADAANKYGNVGGMIGEAVDPVAAKKDNDARRALEAQADKHFASGVVGLNNDLYPITQKASAGSSAAAPGWMSGGGSGARVGGGVGNKAAFLAKYGAMAQQIAQATGNSPNEILAQLAVETGWGTKEIAGSNNPFNVQKGSWGGRTVSANDKHANGTAYGAQFRAYDSYGGAAFDYQSILQNRYRGAIGTDGDIDQFAGALQSGGWAENAQYATSIKRAYAQLQGTPIPDTGSSSNGTAGAGGSKDYTFNHNITLQYPNGQPAASPFSINTSVGAPLPFGQ